jgi:hypothetical protein
MNFISYLLYLFIITENDWSRQVEAHFNKAKGRGRPPDVAKRTNPNTPTRLQLIQIDHIRMKLSKSWKSISVAMGKMFLYPEYRFRHLIERTVCQLGKLDLELVPNFLKEKVDLAFIGPWCDSLRITRPQLLDHTLIDCFSTESRKNGLLLELDSFRNVEKLQYGHLVDWVKTI